MPEPVPCIRHSIRTFRAAPIAAASITMTNPFRSNREALKSTRNCPRVISSTVRAVTRAGFRRPRASDARKTKMFEEGLTISTKDACRYMKDVFVRAMSVPRKNEMGPIMIRYSRQPDTAGLGGSGSRLPPAAERLLQRMTRAMRTAIPLWKNMCTVVVSTGNGKPWPSGAGLKKRKSGAGSTKLLDSLKQHRFFCPVICAGERGGGAPSKPGWAATLDHLAKGAPAPGAGSDPPADRPPKDARQAIEIEKHYGMPMDIEWALDGDDGKLYIVQARPETVKSRSDASVMERYLLKQTGKVLVEGRSIGHKIGSGPVKIITSILLPVRNVHISLF